MKRRRFVQSTVAGGVLASPLGQLLAADNSLLKTPRDYEGPYYPRGPRNRTPDLIVGKPRGRVLYFRGRVVDVRGEPLTGGLVDIWQTDLLGRYKHPDDNSPGARWDDFLYWGEAPIQEDGAFEFRTYVPAAYGRRPSHIHYKVWSNRKLLLTSQLYFAERGGTKGQSRVPRLGDRQTSRLVDIDDDHQEATLEVVV